MGLFNGLIAILVIKILFFKMDIWHVSAIPFDDNPSSFEFVKVKRVERDDSLKTFNSKCSELISQNITKLIPYTETFRFVSPEHVPKYMESHPLLQVRTRLKYKLEVHTIWTCCYGYIQLGSRCVPYCPQCVKSTCTEPGVCTCAKGYRISPNLSNLTIGDCVPECTNGCINSICIRPEICHCNKGYSMDSNGFCRPVCDAECERKNGYCPEPNVCTCRFGYTKIINGSSFTCQSKCNSGYRNVEKTLYDEKVLVCEPICENDCVNGKCIMPGSCVCNIGFVYDKTNQTCKPHCEVPCGPNGECTSPNTCTCFKGYFAVSTTSWFKEPTNGEPACQPKCDFVCVNGKCTAPNTCTCNSDRHPVLLTSLNKKTLHICIKRTKPRCNALSCGSNERCDVFGICACNNGYLRDTDDVCVPFCPFECPNGTCTAPHRCACHNGFALQNDRLCNPICEKGCQNGDCIGPNQCVCHDGFIPNTDYSSPECIPVCNRNCSGHGECVINGHDYKCECHFGWTGWDCDQLTVCVIMMADDHDDVNRITIRTLVNSSIMQVYENAPYCYQCDNDTILSLDNETLCYRMQGNINNIGCLLKTDLLCYNTSTNVTVVIWPLILAVLLVTGLTVTVYTLYRKHQKKELAIGISTSRFVRESITTELLLPDV